MWSRTQALVALSSAEAELYGIVKGTAELKGLVSLWPDLGLRTTGHLLADASAALGILKRRGLGKVRHLNTNYLWVQETMAEREVNYGKIPGIDNRADLFTKALDCDDIDRHVEGLNCEFASGKDDLAYTIHFVGAVPDTTIFNKKMGEILELKGEYSGWARTDIGARTTKTSMRGGPDWSRVKARITMDANDNHLIKVEQARHIVKNCEHALPYGGERDITTILIYENGKKDQNINAKKVQGRCYG